ncbi:hypothetical protein [Bdellovibrio sp. HCB209]|uniref:hypothetical protein n=1 Tax=Bdellovibrio sp. HCB209 TaxID=3394354 RepID=UPI0039B4773D
MFAAVQMAGQFAAMEATRHLVVATKDSNMQMIKAIVVFLMIVTGAIPIVKELSDNQNLKDKLDNVISTLHGIVHSIKDANLKVFIETLQKRALYLGGFAVALLLVSQLLSTYMPFMSALLLPLATVFVFTTLLSFSLWWSPRPFKSNFSEISKPYFFLSTLPLLSLIIEKIAGIPIYTATFQSIENGSTDPLNLASYAITTPWIFSVLLIVASCILITTLMIFAYIISWSLFVPLLFVLKFAQYVAIKINTYFPKKAGDFVLLLIAAVLTVINEFLP